MSMSPRVLALLALLVLMVGAIPAARAAQPLPPAPSGVDPDKPDERDEWFYSIRTAGNPNFTVAQAAEGRARAAQALLAQRNNRPAGGTPQALGGDWAPLGPDPIVQRVWHGSAVRAVAGRVSALAVRPSSPYTIFLGAAQGGLWTYSATTGKWTSKSDQLTSLAIGAIAIASAPNENTMYVGTGEGNLSGDSYYGNGVFRSTDGGNTFIHVGGATFNQVSIAKLAVDPVDPKHLYAAVLRGRAGARRVSPPNPTRFGIWGSTDGGDHWQELRTTTDELKGATDVVIDPLIPTTLYASFWTEGIFKSIDSGLTWKPIMTGLPTNADYVKGLTRFALGLGRTSLTTPATLYTGFDWTDSGGTHHPSMVWKATDNGISPITWSQTSSSVVSDYCGEQCYYDNTIAVEPRNPDVVYALGMFNYNLGAGGGGGIFRSMDGGATWVDLGYGLHPDYHAIAIRGDAPEKIVVGNDGGVWSSMTRGGRTATVPAVDWTDLNGTVNPTDLSAAGTGLQITQFTSVAQHPTNAQVYGGAQDNGTMRAPNLPSNNVWYDRANGDGGQVVVDPTDPRYVYGTYFGVSPYRFSDGMSNFGTNQQIQNGINTNDRSEFYIPFIMDPDNSQRLYLGTYRVYRTDNQGNLWQAISPDLTGGCTGTAPNGARGCVITALGATAGSGALYSGSADGRIYVTTNALVSSPVWTRIDRAPLPPRPIQAFAVDRSNYRVAYVAYGGFSAATPTTPGHLFKTADAGATWTDISSNLPDVPINSVVLDPSHPNMLYVGTDVGPLASYDGGGSWAALGSSFPIVTVNQLNLNPFNRRLVAGSNGRGAWSLSDGTAVPALQLRLSDGGGTVTPGSLVHYTITVKNVGNAGATGVTISDPLPANTTFVSADTGGAAGGSVVTWTGLAVPAASAPVANGGVVAGSITVGFTVRVAGAAFCSAGRLTNDGAAVTSSQGVGAQGSPDDITLSGANACSRKVYVPLVRR